MALGDVTGVLWRRQITDTILRRKMNLRLKDDHVTRIREKEMTGANEKEMKEKTELSHTLHGLLIATRRKMVR